MHDCSHSWPTLGCGSNHNYPFHHRTLSWADIPFLAPQVRSLLSSEQQWRDKERGDKHGSRSGQYFLPVTSMGLLAGSVVSLAPDGLMVWLASSCTSDDPPNAMSNPEQCILNARSNFQSYTIFDNQVNGEFETAMVQKTSTWLVAELNDLTDAKCSRALFTLSRVLSSLAKAESLWDHLNSTRLISSTTDWFVQYILACYIMMDSKIPKAMVRLISRLSTHMLIINTV